jgi:hypothetical protein
MATSSVVKVIEVGLRRSMMIAVGEEARREYGEIVGCGFF